MRVHKAVINNFCYNVNSSDNDCTGSPVVWASHMGMPGGLWTFVVRIRRPTAFLSHLSRSSAWATNDCVSTRRVPAYGRLARVTARRRQRERICGAGCAASSVTPLHLSSPRLAACTAQRGAAFSWASLCMRATILLTPRVALLPPGSRTALPRAGGLGDIAAEYRTGILSRRRRRLRKELRRLQFAIPYRLLTTTYLSVSLNDV